MFTGIIEEIGALTAIKRGNQLTRLTIKADKVLEGTKIGDSIATNGVCLTVCALTKTSFSAELMPETLKKTGFNDYRIGATLNLERALLLSDRLDGHMVTGHIDTCGTLTAIKNLHTTYELTITLSKPHQGLIVEKGSIAINGISLTVISVAPQSFSVGIIPHTFAKTNLKNIQRGQLVNLEFDIQGKYQTAQQKTLTEKSTLDLNLLSTWGY